MEWPQLLLGILGSGAIVALVSGIFQQYGKSREQRVADRRAEIDRVAGLERDVRVFREELLIYRRMVIDAPCLGPDKLRPWPTTPILTKD